MPTSGEVTQLQGEVERLRSLAGAVDVHQSKVLAARLRALLSNTPDSYTSNIDNLEDPNLLK